MLAVFELNESGVRFILRSKEYLSHLIMVTHSTLGRTGLSTDTNTRMSTWQYSGTRLITAESITWLVAQSGTAKVLAGPETGFATKVARSAAGLGTMGMVTAVLTRLTARRTLLGAWFGTLVSTYQGPTAV